jgi:DNA-binding winged helix-turn-helix (wHTH) protein
MTTGTVQTLEPEAERGTISLGSPSGRFIHFGPFRVDRQEAVVTRDGSRIKLSGKAYCVLVSLLARPGEIVTRESFCQQLWPSDNNVDGNSNLSVTIHRLRRVLGDSAPRSRYIETIPRKGYVFVAPPEISDHLDELLRSNVIQISGSLWHSPMTQAGPTPTVFWCMLSLILIGTFFGAGIMAAWISYHGHGPLWH